MTRNEMIKNLEELSQYIAEELQYATHAHEREVFSRWRNTVEEIRSEMIVSREKSGEAEAEEHFDEMIRQLRKEHERMRFYTNEMMERGGISDD